MIKHHYSGINGNLFKGEKSPLVSKSTETNIGTPSMTNKSAFPFHMPKLIAMVGKEDLQIDKYTNSRILEVSKFEDTDKYHFFSVINAYIVKRKIQSI